MYVNEFAFHRITVFLLNIIYFIYFYLLIFSGIESLSLSPLPWSCSFKITEQDYSARKKNIQTIKIHNITA